MSSTFTGSYRGKERKEMLVISDTTSEKTLAVLIHSIQFCRKITSDLLLSSLPTKYQVCAVII